MLELVLKKEFERLKPNLNYKEFRLRWLFFSNKVGLIESSNNLTAKNPTTTAKGYYQFTDDSLITGYNRLQRYGVFTKLPIIEQDLELQTALFIANISQQKGTDDLILGMLNNSISSQKELYSKFHHTNPDEATIILIDKVFVKLA